ncbi:MAG: type II toxin-antitoxin system VapC family toxin [Acidobacteria bacterium]|nr:type II toxin-antitoxin system VapC family toxin [Acidobacteriota bacterium]MBI3265200.1 type II toxin-antitoxin system VapC family toxin [Acidobacteriota bacterium]
MRPAVYLDTGIFIAFLNRRDQWHPQAVALFSTAKPRWSTSVLVVSEAYSWFLHRMGEEAARSLLALLNRLHGLHLYEASTAHHEATVGMLERYRGTKLTYVDASSLCLMADHRISTVWATDHHLGLAGAEVLPRS